VKGALQQEVGTAVSGDPKKVLDALQKKAVAATK
jgi:hypothetical protein